MRFEENTFYQDNEIKLKVQRYEQMKREKVSLYFDVHEFEDIIDFYLGNNSIGSASEAVRFGLDQHPSSMAIQMREAQVLTDRGKISQSLKILWKLSSIERSNHEVFLLLGTVLNIKGDHKQAIENFDRALSLNPEDKDEVASHIGISLQNRERFIDAIKYFKLALKLNPNRFINLYEQAYCNEKLGRYSKAESYYKAYLDKEPYAEIGWYSLGVVRSGMEKYRESIDAYDYALAINDKNTATLFNKANILFLLKQYQDAADVYTELLEIEPDNINGLLYIAECYEELGLFDKAEHYLKEAQLVKPDSADAFYGMGLLSMKKNDVRESRRFIRKAISLDNENPEFWFALSRSYQLDKRYESATNAIDKTLELDPFSQDYWVEKAYLESLNGKLKSAIATLKKSFSYIPENAQVHYKLGILLLKTFSFEKGLSHIEEGLILDYELSKEVFETEKKIFYSKEVQSLLSKHKKL
ncbi:MAG: tetratricopeptide repeat protein [Bacteroidota bacterium]|nr:tetratricopeptide repeat protein [Bacteroidota bacterium]